MATKKKAKKPAKVSSKRLATIAGRYAGISKEQFFWAWTHNSAANYDRLYKDVVALAASVLSQTEPVKKARK